MFYFVVQLVLSEQQQFKSHPVHFLLLYKYGIELSSISVIVGQTLSNPEILIKTQLPAMSCDALLGFVSMFKCYYYVTLFVSFIDITVSLSNLF